MANTIEFNRQLSADMRRLYRTKGYSYVVTTLNKLVKDSNKKAKASGKPELATTIRGECTELLLEFAIKEFARTRNLPWIVQRGLTIDRRDHRKGTTELDITLFTPPKIVLFESKYRKNKCKLVEECTMIPDWGNHFDVYKQNMMHLDNLRRYMGPGIKNLNAGKPFSTVLFVESLDRIDDRRTDKWKSVFPVVSLENTLQYLTNIENQKQEVWDMKKVLEIVKELDANSEAKFKEHMRRMTGKR